MVDRWCIFAIDPAPLLALATFTPNGSMGRPSSCRRSFGRGVGWGLLGARLGSALPTCGIQRPLGTGRTISRVSPHVLRFIKFRLRVFWVSEICQHFD